MSTESGPFIEEASAHRQVAHTCLDYLMFSSFDTNTSDEDIDIAILGGHCVLQAYATSHWLDHVKEGTESGISSEEFMSICYKILIFLSRRTNPNFDRKKNSRRERVLDLKQFEGTQQHIYEWLCRITSSSSLDLPEDPKARKDQSKCPMLPLVCCKAPASAKSHRPLGCALMTMLELKYALEPIVLRECWDRIQSRYEDLICPSKHRKVCWCLVIESAYGARMFKCDRLVCDFSRKGFKTKAGRDRHAESHSRTFKCGFATCKFATTGFLSQTQLEQHTELFHMMKGLDEMEGGPAVDLNRETLEQAMLDAVELGETDYLKSILDRVSQPPLNFLMHIAYLKGSTIETLEALKERGAWIDDRESLRLLAKVGDRDPAIPNQIWTAMVRIREEYNIFQTSSERRSVGIAEGPQTALTEAIEGGSVEAVRWVLAQKDVDVEEQVKDHRNSVTPLDYLFARQLTRSRDKRSRRPLLPEIIQLLLESGADVTNGRSLQSLIQCQFLPEEDDSYLQMARLLIKYGSSVRTDALHHVIGTNYSRGLGQLLIDSGADLEIPFYGGSPETPLLRCLTANHKKAAEFARFLLESGAKTKLRSVDLSLKNNKIKLDPKKFTKWAGTTWDELVDSMQSSDVAMAV